MRRVDESPNIRMVPPAAVKHVKPLLYDALTIPYGKSAKKRRLNFQNSRHTDSRKTIGGKSGMRTNENIAKH